MKYDAKQFYYDMYAKYEKLTREALDKIGETPEDDLYELTFWNEMFGMYQRKREEYWTRYETLLKLDR